ncbi:MAG: hypothetical protein IJ774_05325 [Selenomonadaceae bacterium]|nr:hypothetical protein [Selenomonadaceae bacterium]
MTEQEQINQQLQRQIDEHDAKFDKVMLKVDMALEELLQQREDMRRLWDRQDEERREFQKRQDALQAKHDAEMHEMNQRFYDKFDAMDNKIDANFKTLSNQIHSNFVQTMVGFGAIAAVGGIIVAAFK